VERRTFALGSDRSLALTVNVFFVLGTMALLQSTTYGCRNRHPLYCPRGTG